MSLINDALKRAKHAQQEAAPPPKTSDDLRPVEMRQYGRQPVGLAIPALLGLASLILLVLLWQASRNANSRGDLEVNARTKPSPAPAATPAPETASPAATAHASATQVSPASATPTIAATPELAVATASNPVATVAGIEPSTNPMPVVAVTPPKPALPKLQAIVYNPKRPSVMLSGKTLWVGDKIGEYRVRAIDQESVTIVSATQTNVLTLESN
jgi:hypothetical protein